LPSIRALMEATPRPQIVIFAGKGGLGKTTSSAALAVHMARQGVNTLCFSTDPQASLSDVFERDVFGKGIVELEPNLAVVEIDADRRVADYQAEVKQKILDMYGLDKVPDEIEEYIDSTSAEPAMYESATYDAMAELVAAGDYDLYIFDMPPFGHGVRMVAMAEILSTWVDKITQARQQVAEYDAVAKTLKGEKGTEDAVLGELLAIRSKISAFTSLLTDRARTAFFMVLIPERMAILDTARALTMFSDLGINLSGLIVNQVYPPELAERGEFLASRVAMQREHLERIGNEFSDRVAAVLPTYPKEPKGLPMLAQVAEDLMAESGALSGLVTGARTGGRR
jgi:arsenite/tail-anchored protein-transporting ATPase